MDQEIAKGAGVAETSPSTNGAGVYRHPQAKKEIITQPGEPGKIQADALVRLGFVRVGDVPSRVELKKMNDLQAAKDRAADAAQKAKEEGEVKAAEEAAAAELDKASK
jgi:arginyl-tRNA--protein-N-Asp/Glu arginylyltransferase